ncbi:MAG: DUF4339 domain-containing protein [Kiritimatiellae bacterium]|nr:DUF4339 domain-containing protein [Kiritimatiellia bacterium]
MSAWYLKKSDGSVFGPVDTPDLKEWAADGRVAPDDQVSPDQKKWQAAPSLDELGMCWNITVEGDESFGPLHILALCDLVEQGSVARDAQITNTKTGETFAAGEALLTALLSEWGRLRADTKEKEGAWQMLLQKERQIAQGRETDLRQKLEKARQMQGALAESLKKIEQGITRPAAPGGAVAEDAGATDRLKKLEKELGEVKAELDLERRRLREEKEEWQRRAKHRDEEKARLEEEVKELRVRLVGMAGEVPVEKTSIPEGKAAEPAEAGEARPAETGEEEPADADSVSHVMKAAAARLKAQAAAQKKSPSRLGRNGRKGISSSQIRRGPM